MKLIYNNIDNKDLNSIFYPEIDEDHLVFHKLNQNDIQALDQHYKLLCDIIDESDKLLIINSK